MSRRGFYVGGQKPGEDSLRVGGIGSSRRWQGILAADEDDVCDLVHLDVVDVLLVGDQTGILQSALRLAYRRVNPAIASR